MDIWTGLVIGFLGSFHCIGMCGPIALAIPVNSENQFMQIFTRVLYNLGRVITYSFFGLMFGLFGNRLVLIGFQQYFSIIFGVLIILYFIIPVKYRAKFSQLSFYRSLVNDIKLVFGKLMARKSNSSFLFLGMMNGLLPCGFVYVALAGAITLGDALSGMIFMALFGLGTFPVMLGATMLGKFLNLQIRAKINKAIPVLAIILALLFIIRGLGLGIPYLSPNISNFFAPEEINCH